MDHLLAILVLVACCAVGLALVPLGLPGLWLMVLGVLGYGGLTAFRTVGAGLVGLVVGLALAGEVAEWWLGFALARRYGGSRRAGWGALAGGLLGAAVGVPVPIVGSVIGAFAGAFAGAALFEYTRAREAGTALNAGWGAVLGRAAAAAVKLGLGIAIAIAGAVAALRG
jgi:hypothetical protein